MSVYLLGYFCCLPHRWPLLENFTILVPTLILSYAFMEYKFSMTLLERIWVRLVTVLWYGKAKQAKPKNEEVKFHSPEAIMTLFLLRRKICWRSGRLVGQDRDR